MHSNRRHGLRLCLTPSPTIAVFLLCFLPSSHVFYFIFYTSYLSMSKKEVAYMNIVFNGVGEYDRFAELGSALGGIPGWFFITSC